MASEENALDAVERIIGSAQRMVASHLDLLRIEISADASNVLRRVGRTLLGAGFLLVAWGALVCAAFVVLRPYVSLAWRFAGVAALHGCLGVAFLRSGKPGVRLSRQVREVGESPASESHAPRPQPAPREAQGSVNGVQPTSPVAPQEKEL
jgi:uncharacterized membrane protein YqjE